MILKGFVFRCRKHEICEQFVHKGSVASTMKLFVFSLV